MDVKIIRDQLLPVEYYRIWENTYTNLCVPGKRYIRICFTPENSNFHEYNRQILLKGNFELVWYESMLRDHELGLSKRLRAPKPESQQDLIQ